MYPAFFYEVIGDIVQCQKSIEIMDFVNYQYSGYGNFKYCVYTLYSVQTPLDKN